MPLSNYIYFYYLTHTPQNNFTPLKTKLYLLSNKMHFNLQQCGGYNVPFYEELEYACGRVNDTTANSLVVSAHLPRAVVLIRIHTMQKYTPV